jgi:NAD(P)-dependent dehydrogenase (short-subunit alcohol dehydrogenase family)
VASPEARVSGEKAFGAADQADFAAFSGDVNPLHMDHLAARRTQAGGAAVHGVHLVLWALDTAAAQGVDLGALSEIAATFHTFVRVEEPVGVAATPADDGALTLLVGDPQRPAVTIRLHRSGRAAAPPNPLESAPPAELGTAPFAPPQFDDLTGWLSDRSVQGRFSALSRAIGEERVGALALTSSVVGMCSPGLHSIYSSLKVRLVEGGGRKGLGWRSRVPNLKFARVIIDVAGSGIVGELRALVRPQPVEAPPMAALIPRLATGEFRARRALVIGGSRGLGALTAKLLAAGGAEVVLTYVVGAADSGALVDDIRGAGGAARALACDMGHDWRAPLSAPLREATHIYYFATPRIARQSLRGFSARDLADFNRIYLDAFAEMCAYAADLNPGRRLSVLYPSSVAIDDPPRNMVEYAMSKAAGEVLCRVLARAHPNLSIAAPRLPRILTDQTASAITAQSADGVEVMLPLLRAETDADDQVVSTTE